MDQYIIIYAFFSILLVYIVFQMANDIVLINASCNCNKENFANNTTHTIDLPIVNPVSCTNFCGPNAKCVKTGQQCLADIDCFGCGLKQPVTDIYSYEASGKLGPNLTYSSLTSGYNSHSTDFEEASPGSYVTEVGQPYLGVNTWQKSFNQGLALYNKKHENNPPLTPFEKEIKPAYPVHLSMTGLFYETTPLPGNVPTNMG